MSRIALVLAYFSNLNDTRSIGIVNEYVYDSEGALGKFP